MVSWCINTLDIDAQAVVLDAFITASCVEGWLLRMENADAPPRRLRANRLLDWRQAHWGTTLDIHPDDLEFRRPDPAHATWHFHSPSTPPLAWAENVSRAYPQLHLALSYSVPDHGLLGSLELVHGRQQPAGTWTRAVPSDRLLCAEPGCWLYGENVVHDVRYVGESPEVSCFWHRRAASRREHHSSVR